MRTLASRLLLGVLLLVAAGVVLGFESEGGRAAPSRFTYDGTRALLAGAGIGHIKGVRQATQRELQGMPLALRKCPAWMYGASATGGHVNVWVCKTHADALGAVAFIVRGSEIGGPDIRFGTNANLVLIVLARSSQAATRLIGAVGSS